MDKYRKEINQEEVTTLTTSPFYMKTTLLHIFDFYNHWSSWMVDSLQGINIPSPSSLTRPEPIKIEKNVSDDVYKKLWIVLPVKLLFSWWKSDSDIYIQIVDHITQHTKTKHTGGQYANTQTDGIVEAAFFWEKKK